MNRKKRGVHISEMAIMCPYNKDIDAMQKEKNLVLHTLSQLQKPQTQLMVEDHSWWPRWIQPLSELKRELTAYSCLTTCVA